MQNVQYCRSYEEYQRLAENDMKQGREPLRREVLDGAIHITSMATKKHQNIVANLREILGNFIKSKQTKCDVIIAPFDVRLNYGKKSKENESDEIVQPDVLVSCSDKIIDGKFLAGAPEVVFEVLSENRRYDKVKKMAKYEEYGVKEYFIVDQFTDEIKYYNFMDENDVIEKNYKEKDDMVFIETMDYSIKLSDIFGETSGWLLDLLENKEFIENLKR